MKTKFTKVQLAVIIAATVAILSISAVSIAYLSDTGSAVNTLSIGENSITITEDYTPPSAMQQGDNKFAKEVSITNLGDVPCYVRVFADFSDSKVKDISFLSAKTVAESATGDWIKAAEYKDHLPSGWVFVPTTDATLGGFYYYTEPLAPGAVTPHLFRAVNAHFDTEDLVTDFEIVVSAESVQTLDKNGNAFSGADAWKQAWTEFLTRR